jgi:hypothetical protein
VEDGSLETEIVYRKRRTNLLFTWSWKVLKHAISGCGKTKLRRRAEKK